MSASDFFAGQGYTAIAIESPFGTISSVLQASVDPTQSSITPSRAVVPIKDERTRAWQALSPLLGPLSATAKIAMDLRPPTAQLDTAASPASTYISWLQAIMGGEAHGAGSLVATATSASQFIVTAGQGSRFTIGSWCAVGINGGTLEARRITNISTDTITVCPAFSASTVIGDLVMNSYTWYLTPTNTQSVGLQRAMVNDTGFAWTARGGTGNVSFGFDSTKIVQAIFDLKFASWEFGAIASHTPAITISAFTETLASQMLAFQAQTYLWPSATTTVPTHYPFEPGGVEYSVACGNEHIMELGGSLQNAVGVVRKPDRDGHRVKTKVRADSQWQTVFTAQTLYSVMTIIPIGTGSTRRFVIFDAPSCVLVEQPQYSGDILKTDLVWMPKEDTTTTGVGNCALSPIRVAVI